MLVTLDKFKELVQSPKLEFSIDTETTGLYSFNDDHLFSVIISDDTEDFYVNFLNYPEQAGLPRELLNELKPLLEKQNAIWYLQNAKFDMHMLAREGLYIRGKIYDIAVLDRIYFNQHMRYSLAEISKRWGDEKLDIVWNYIQDNKLIEKTELPELDKVLEKPLFSKVPLNIMQPYGEQDGRATFNLGRKILKNIADRNSDLHPGIPSELGIIENEARLTKTLFHMEQTGIQLDIPYCQEALSFYKNILKEKEIEFKILTDLDFVKGTTVFEQVFKEEAHKWERTEKDNWKWSSDVLEKFEHPAAKIVIDWAEAKKQSEYFANFLFYSDPKGVLHPSFQQAGTVTSRLSCRDPNLQNLSNPDKYEETSDASLYPVRKAFVPRPGFFLVMIDYAQSEYRLFLEYAKAHDVIKEVLAGKDVHQANADIAKVTRKQAKTVGFGLLYGQGVGKLTHSLFQTMGSERQVQAIYKHKINFGITFDDRIIYANCSDEIKNHDLPLIEKAQEIKNTILNSSPEYGALIKGVTDVAKTRGYIRNFYGRRLHFPDKKFAYKAVNHLIQSSCADMIKFAMNEIHDYLQGKESRLVSQIHDELVFEVKYGEEHIIEDLKDMMQKAYPHKILPQVAEASIAYNHMAE